MKRNFNYRKICSDLLKDFLPKQKEVMVRRFGLAGGERETLESIGQSFGLTRERVRQIEEEGISKIKPNLNQVQKTIHSFTQELKNTGGLRKEDVLLANLGGKEFQPQVFFLLTLAEPFKRFAETKELHSFWALDCKFVSVLEKAIGDFYNQLKKTNRPLPLAKYKSPVKINAAALQTFLEISKNIQQNQEGLFGLREWPEINPRGVKDKAYLVFRKEQKPLHFLQVTELIGPNTLPQTVHNELIKDQRFVLVGRGLYALKEWGYEQGQVKDVISKILREAGRPLPKEKILAQVLKQRLVKENTILLNLTNKNYFIKDTQGRYTVKEA